MQPAAAERLFAAYTTCLFLHSLIATQVLAEAHVAPSLATRMRSKRDQLDELCRSGAEQRSRRDLVVVRKDVLGLLREALPVA